MVRGMQSMCFPGGEICSTSTYPNDQLHRQTAPERHDFVIVALCIHITSGPLHALVLPVCRACHSPQHKDFPPVSLPVNTSCTPMHAPLASFVVTLPPRPHVRHLLATFKHVLFPPISSCVPRSGPRSPGCEREVKVSFSTDGDCVWLVYLSRGHTACTIFPPHTRLPTPDFTH
jgi:hypothetical protein